jgi:hypothetical protein
MILMGGLMNYIGSDSDPHDGKLSGCTQHLTNGISSALAVTGLLHGQNQFQNSNQFNRNQFGQNQQTQGPCQPQQNPNSHAATMERIKSQLRAANRPAPFSPPVSRPVLNNNNFQPVNRPVNRPPAPTQNNIRHSHLPNPAPVPIPTPPPKKSGGNAPPCVQSCPGISNVKDAADLADFACRVYNSHQTCLSTCDPKIRAMISSRAGTSKTCTKRAGPNAKLTVDPFAPTQPAQQQPFAPGGIDLSKEAGRTTTEAGGRSMGSSADAGADASANAGVGTDEEGGEVFARSSSGSRDGPLSDEKLVATVDSWIENLSLDEEAGCSRTCHAVTDAVTDSFCQLDCGFYVGKLPGLCASGCR